ncbi:MAG: class I adenylate-forming enzyme family protein [Rhodopila sp.]|nr:class I adenylate-forming enzyme family protein [Rhodopila sp.]
MSFDSIGNRSLVRAIEFNRQWIPHRPFLEFRGRPLSYRDFGRMVASAANGLLRLGVRAGDRVLIQMVNCPEHLVAIFAIQRIGAINVTCSTLFKLDETAYQLRDSGSTMIICGAEFLDLARAAADAVSQPVHILVTDHGLLDAGEAPFNRLLCEEGDQVGVPFPAADDVAMLIYTSGTTGRPKGVIYTHGNLVSGGQNSIIALGYRPEERLLHFFPLYHSNGGVILLAPVILSGCCMVMIDKFSASRFGVQLVEHRITLTALNATHIKMILAHPALDAERAHGVARVQFALPLDDARREAFRDRFGGIRLVEVFGQTETCGIVTAVPEGALWKPGSAGLPLPGIEMKVTDDQGGALDTGTPGELCLRSLSRHGLTPGYYNSPDLTRDLYRDGWLRTGDVVIVDEDGYMVYFERKKDLIKRSGINIAAAEVERAMLEVPGVAEAAVVGIPDEFREEKIIGFVVAAPGAVVRLDDVERHCREALADYKVPERFELLDALPENFLGKVEKKVLRERAVQRFGS